MIKAFWRKVPLSHNELALLNKLSEAHHKATFRANASSEVLKAAYAMNGGDFFKALAAGLCTMGGLHAPIEQAYDVLTDEDLDWGGTWVGPAKIPGWGNSFVKGKADPIVENVMLYVDTMNRLVGERIEEVTDILHAAGKKVYPNMACATAATAIILGMPRQLAPTLLVSGRADAWAELIYELQRPGSGVDISQATTDSLS